MVGCGSASLVADELSGGNRHEVHGFIQANPELRQPEGQLVASAGFALAFDASLHTVQQGPVLWMWTGLRKKPSRLTVAGLTSVGCHLLVGGTS